MTDQEAINNARDTRDRESLLVLWERYGARIERKLSFKVKFAVAAGYTAEDVRQLGWDVLIYIVDHLRDGEVIAGYIGYAVWSVLDAYVSYRTKRGALPVSLDYSDSGDDDDTLIDTIYSTDDVGLIVEEREMIAAVRDLVVKQSDTKKKAIASWLAFWENTRNKDTGRYSEHPMRTQDISNFHAFTWAALCDEEFMRFCGLKPYRTQRDAAKVKSRSIYPNV